MNRACVYCLNTRHPYLLMAKTSISMLRKFSDIPIVALVVQDTWDSTLDDFTQFAKQYQVDIEIKSPLKFADSFLINKSYLKDLDIDQILFLDSDTFIFGDVQHIFNSYRDYDFVACEDVWAYHQGYSLTFLEKMTRPFNSGVMFFNGCHKEIYSQFKNVYLNLYEATCPLGQWLKETNNQWTLDEFAVSKIVDESNLKYTHFHRRMAYNIRNKEDFCDMQESLVFHPYRGQWATVYENLLHKN